MTTCIESIAGMGSIESLTEIVPNTVMPFTVDGSSNRLFRLQSPVFQTVRFISNLSLNPPVVTISVFKWNGTAATPYGSVNITNHIQTAYMDFPIGDYIICVRTPNGTAQTGTFVCEFTGYSQQVRFALNAYGGEVMDAPLSGPPRPPRECGEALFFRIEEGELPPGLIIDHLGTITGWLPNLDCLEDSPSPAVNWYYEENDGTSWPWGREWRFQVKVWIEGMEADAWAREWFCVRVHNNWSYDQENFLAQSPFVEIKDIKVVTPALTLPKSVCQPCDDFVQPAPFVPSPINETCAPCNARDQSTTVELIAIPSDLCNIQPDDFLPWFDANQNVDSNNPFIEKFKRDLAESSAFAILRQRAGYVETKPDTQAEDQLAFVTAMNYQNFLQLATTRINEDSDPDSLSQLMKQWQDAENQALPTTGYAHSGEDMEIRID